jgi:hypothetical protein
MHSFVDKLAPVLILSVNFKKVSSRSVIVAFDITVVVYLFAQNYEITTGDNRH